MAKRIFGWAAAAALVIAGALLLHGFMPCSDDVPFFLKGTPAQCPRAR